MSHLTKNTIALFILLMIRICYSQIVIDSPLVTLQHFRYGSGAYAVFSSDGKYLLTSGCDSDAKLWDVQTGDLIRVFSGHEDFVSSALFSSDNRYIVTSSFDGTAKIWDVTTGYTVTSLTTIDNRPLTSAAFSPDEKKVIIGLEPPLTASDRAAIAIDIATSEEAGWFFSSGRVEIIAFSRTGKYLVTGGWSGNTHIWNGKSYEEIHRILTGSIKSAFFTPDETTLIVVKDYYDWEKKLSFGEIKFYSVKTGTLVKGYVEFDNGVHAALSPNGKYIFLTSYYTSRIILITTGETVETFPESDKMIKFAAYSPDGSRVATGDKGGNFKIWDVSDLAASGVEQWDGYGR